MYISSDSPLIFTIGSFIVISILVYNIFKASIRSNFSIGAKIYSLCFLVVFASSFLVAAISNLLDDKKTTATAFIVLVASLAIFVGSAFLLDGIKKLKHKDGFKKFATAPKHAGTIVGLKIASPPIVSTSPEQYNHYGRYLHIIFKYIDNNGVSTICTSYLTYSEKEVTHLLNLDQPIQICVYNNKCTISTPIQNLKDDIDTTAIEELLKKQDYNDDSNNEFDF